MDDETVGKRIKKWRKLKKMNLLFAIGIKNFFQKSNLKKLEKLR